MVELPRRRGYLRGLCSPGIGLLATSSPPAFSLETFLHALQGGGTPSTFTIDYHNTHARRFAETGRLIAAARRGRRAIEIGATDYFQLALGTTFGYPEVWGSVMSDDPERKLHTRTVAAAGHSLEVTAVSLDIERELFPVTPGYSTSCSSARCLSTWTSTRCLRSANSTVSCRWAAS